MTNPGVFAGQLTGYYAKVAAMRSRSSSIMHLSRQQLVPWVAAHHPQSIVSAGEHGPFAANATPGGEAIGQVTYAEVCHGRDDLINDRLASIVYGLLHGDDIDQFARAVADPTADPTWTTALNRRGAVPNDPRRYAKWFIAEGNHRVLAQAMLGIDPFVRRRHGQWSWH